MSKVNSLTVEIRNVELPTLETKYSKLWSDADSIARDSLGVSAVKAFRMMLAGDLGNEEYVKKLTNIYHQLGAPKKL